MVGKNKPIHPGHLVSCRVVGRCSPENHSQRGPRTRAGWIKHGPQATSHRDHSRSPATAVRQIQLRNADRLAASPLPRAPRTFTTPTSTLEPRNLSTPCFQAPNARAPLDQVSVTTPHVQKVARDPHQPSIATDLPATLPFGLILNVRSGRAQTRSS